MAPRNAKMANRNMGKGGPTFVPSPLVKRITPLGGGTHAYVSDAEGRNLKLALSDERFVPTLVEVEAALPGRIVAEVAELAETYPSWVAVRDELTVALASDVVEVADAA